MGVLAFLSGLQYVNQHWAYASTWNLIRYQHTFKRRVNELLDAEMAAYKRKLSKAEKEVLRERVEQQVFDSEVRVSGSGSKKPSVWSLVGVRVVFLPLTITRGLYRFLQWHWHFSWRGEEYGDEERIYLTCRALRLPESEWEVMGPKVQSALLERELWRPEQLKEYTREREEELRQRRAQSGAYKRARRLQRAGDEYDYD